jgi:squalene-hopene/tetraprenyl-beta-curcumene cyclase
MKSLMSLAVALLAMGCAPKDERPGLWLNGDLVENRIDDWSFTNDIEELFIETRPWYGVSHSTTIWCVTLDGTLYIGSYGDEKKTWEKNVARNPEARLAIEGRLYEVTVAPVSDAELTESLDRAYSAKYDMAEVFGEDLPKWWYYRVSQRGPWYGDANTVQFEDLAPEIVFGPYSREDSLAEEYSAERAALFLDRVATDWGKKYQCVTCHTNGYYLTAPPELFRDRPAFREARQQAQDFVDAWEAFTPNSILAVLGYADVPETYVVATAAFLAINDAAFGDELAGATLRALDRAWEMQDEEGAWPGWIICNWPPFESDEHYGATLMAIAVGMTPVSYRKTQRARDGMARIRAWLVNHNPTEIHQKAMLLWAAKLQPDLVEDPARERWIAELSELQRADGGWASGELGRWRQLEGDPSDPPVGVESDGYGTGFVTFVLRQAGVPASDPRIRRGIAWLKTHQRVDGNWWTQSLRNEPDTSNFLTHTGTTFALKALAASDEIQ